MTHPLWMGQSHPGRPSPSRPPRCSTIVASLLAATFIAATCVASCFNAYNFRAAARGCCASTRKHIRRRAPPDDPPPRQRRRACRARPPRLCTGSSRRYLTGRATGKHLQLARDAHPRPRHDGTTAANGGIVGDVR